MKASKASWSIKEGEGFTLSKGTVKGTSFGRGTVLCAYDPYKIEGVTGTGFTYATTVYVEDVKLNKEDSRLVEKKTGTSYTLTLENGDRFVLQSENAWQPVSFGSSKPAIAFVDEAGVVSARSKGKATISARVNGKKISVAVVVK